MPALDSLRYRGAGLIAAAITAAGLAIGGPGQVTSAAALNAPTGLEVAHHNSSTPILSWTRVAGVDHLYEVQVDDDPGFGSPNYSGTTSNYRIVPSNPLPSGTVHWRVRARSGSSSSAWSTIEEFSVSPPEIPVPLAPTNGALLQQPDSPPLLRWSASKGALSYAVQLDGDSDFIGAKTYTTKSTSFIWPEALGAGDWWWRVTASKAAGIISRPSVEQSFEILPLRLPVLTAPADNFGESVEDVVLDWQPVPGAQTYDVQIALDQNFQNFATTATSVRGTRFSPDVTINNDEFWWRVRAVDTAGQSTPWTESRYSFKRQWLDRATPVWPLGTASAPGTQGVDTTYFQWTPVQHASHYELEVARDVEFTQGLLRCSTAGTTYVPRFTSGDCLSLDTDSSGGQPRFWRVRAIDRPYPTLPGLPGVFSTPQAFHRAPQPAPEASGDTFLTHATGLKVTATGEAAGEPGQGCQRSASVGYPDSATYTPPALCPSMRTTPVLSWDRYPGAEYYVVWFGQDENFTTTEVQPIRTNYNMFALDERVPRAGQGPWTLPESESGHPYYWYVQPCTATACAPRPDSQAVGVSGAASFQKVSPPVTGLQSAATAKNDVTFSWEDYVVTNDSVFTHGESGQQAAQNYRVVVDNEPSFSSPLLDSHVVDQATYTAKDRLYPEGTLYWKVQALDAGDDARDTTGHGLTWSATQQVIKSSDPVALSSPVGGAEVAGTVPLRWQTQAFAVKYELEVYKGNDTAFSPANRVVQVSTGTTAYAPQVALPASADAYVWRVRRVDSSNNLGPWSTVGRFISKGAVPQLITPIGDTYVATSGAFFEWSDVPGAATFRINARSNSGATLTKTTTATAYAPTTLPGGGWTWTVTALDNAGQSVGTSPVGRFRVDAASPTVTRYSPTTSAKRKANVKIVFSEPVVRTTVTRKSFQLRKQGSRRTTRARVTSSSDGLRAVLNPSKALRRGTYYTVTLKPRITDPQGNALTARTWTFRVR